MSASLKRLYVHHRKEHYRETDVLLQVGGLAVTRNVPLSGELSEKDPAHYLWNVTHLNSGVAVAAELREDSASKLAQELAGVADWEALTFDEVVRLLKDAAGARTGKVRAAIARARREDSE
jgi:hypothetical protein